MTSVRFHNSNHPSRPMEHHMTISSSGEMNCLLHDINSSHNWVEQPSLLLTLTGRTKVTIRPHIRGLIPGTYYLYEFEDGDHNSVLVWGSSMVSGQLFFKRNGVLLAAWASGELYDGYIDDFTPWVYFRALE
jgi:hypothetical protein